MLIGTNGNCLNAYLHDLHTEEAQKCGIHDEKQGRVIELAKLMGRRQKERRSGSNGGVNEEVWTMGRERESD